MMFIISVLSIKQMYSDLRSVDICFKNKRQKEKCARKWYYECGKNYCMTSEDVCDSFNEIEKVVRINEM
jgi:hypothetical protein